MRYKKKVNNMDALTMDNKSFTEFVKKNKEKVYRLAEQNTVRNSKGQVVITKDDPWHDENEWDEYCKELEDNEHR